MRKFVAAVTILMISFGVAMADDFFGVIKSVEGNKINVVKMKKGEKGEEATLTVAENVKIVKGGKYNKETKKVEGGDVVEGGLKNELFAKGKVMARITTTDGKVTDIRVMEFKKKKDSK